MITTSDIRKILSIDAQSLGIGEIYPKENVPEGNVESERVVIIVKDQSTETYWDKCFANINIDVPDLDEYGNADLPRLEDLERLAHNVFEDVCGEFNGSHYVYTWDSIGIERDNGLRCHYVAVRILFEVLNVK